MARRPSRNATTTAATPPAAPAGTADAALAAFACPNEDCPDFNRFGAGNLSVCERMGKNKHIRRLYCRTCQHRFSERQGTLLQDAKLPEESVVRIVKCLVHGCSIEATADICEVATGTVAKLLEKAGRRAEDFHRLHLERLSAPPEVVELDELHGRAAPAKKGAPTLLAKLAAGCVGVAARAGLGFTRRCASPAAS